MVQVMAAFERRAEGQEQGSGARRRSAERRCGQAEQRGYTRVSLETGSMEFFRPARALYASFGFAPCPPFADYREDPNSVFMTKAL